MREKTARVIITFHTTSQAMAMEKICKQEQIPGRIIPIPREISAGCGFAFSAPPESREQLKRMIEAKKIDIDNIYECVI